MLLQRTFWSKGKQRREGVKAREYTASVRTCGGRITAFLVVSNVGARRLPHILKEGSRQAFAASRSTVTPSTGYDATDSCNTITALKKFKTTSVSLQVKTRQTD